MYANRSVSGADAADGPMVRQMVRQMVGMWIGSIAALAFALASASALALETPDSFADLAERLLPSVVNISTTQVVQGREQMETPQAPPG